MRIAMVSEHADPTAAPGGEDAGGQNVHVAALARALGGTGPCGRRLHPAGQPGRGAGRAPRPGVEVHRLAAGPAAPLPKDELLPHMAEFGAALGREWARQPPGPGPRPLLDVRAGQPAAARRASAFRWRRPSTRSARSRPATRGPGTPAHPSGSTRNAGSAWPAIRSSPPAVTRCGSWASSASPPARCRWCRAAWTPAPSGRPARWPAGSPPAGC